MVFRVDAEEEEPPRLGEDLEFESEPNSRAQSREGSIDEALEDMEEGEGAEDRREDTVSRREIGEEAVPGEMDDIVDAAQPSVDMGNLESFSRSTVTEQADADSVLGSLKAISLHHLARFIQHTVYAPLPSSAQDILLQRHPQLRGRGRAASYPRDTTGALPGSRHQSHRSEPFQTRNSHRHDTAHLESRFRVADVLGSRTKFGGLVPFQSTWHGRQVWIVRLVS